MKDARVFMATVYVNDKPVDVGSDRINLVQAAQRADVLIPHYCWHPALSVVASCRMCLVEVGDRKPDGTVTMQPRVVPACQTPAKDGTVVLTDSPKTKQAQQQTLEMLLLNHPLDCPVCDKAGECLLQDYSYRFGNSQSRMIDAKNQPPNNPHIGERITLFTDRCIMCTRCVRFTREISGQGELHVLDRGTLATIETFPERRLNNKLAGNVVDICPVGALCDKEFLYTQRVWFLKEQASVCPDCSTGCSIHIDHNKDMVYRLRPRANPQAQGDFMCDDGRFDYRYIQASERFRRPLVRRELLRETSWDALVSALRRELADLAARDGAAVAAVLSPFLTCEEAFLLAKFAKSLSPHTRLALGRVPVHGADDTYPKDYRGRPLEPVRFTVRSEKCPNRRGVEAILRHFQGEVLSFDQIMQAAGTGELKGLYVSAGYPPRKEPWISADQAKGLERVPLLIVHDLFPSPASSVANYVVPAASYAEKDGTFVNHAGLAQALRWAVRPIPELRPDGQVFLDLLERRGLVHAASIRQELAAEVPYFAALAGDLGEQGVRLEPVTNR
jgi:NADH-quinone oxidoreductase subunit G